MIPKDIRQELDIDEGTGFWMFSITDEGILLKKIDSPEMSESDPVVSKIINKSNKIDVNYKNVSKAVKHYKKQKSGRLEEI